MYFNYKKAAFICFDMVLASSASPFHVVSPIEIEISYKTKTYRKKIKNIRLNEPKYLNIKKSVKYRMQDEVDQAKVTIYHEDIFLQEESIKINRSSVGSIKTSKISDIYTITLLYRVINTANTRFVINNVTKYHLEDFLIHHGIGSGKYGEVYLAYDKRSLPHVLKRMFRHIDITNRNDATIREILPFITIPEHPCIIRLDGFIHSKRYGMILVLENASLGKITSVNFNSLEKNIKCKLIYGIFSCIAFLHDYGYIHRDIHPSNILVTSKYEIKLIDFGVSRFIDDDMTRDVGHQGFISSEMSMSESYCEKTDEYSLGKILKKLNSSDIYLKFFSEIFNEDDQNSRMTCSEACTLIECGLFHYSNTILRPYFDKLNMYHKSSPVSDSSIFQTAAYFMDKNITSIACDMFKLLHNTGFKDSETFYINILKHCEGAAYDLEYIDYNPEMGIEADEDSAFRFSEDKSDISHYYTMGFVDEISNNFTSFLATHTQEFSKKYFLKIPREFYKIFFSNIFFTTCEYFIDSIIKSIYRISKSENNPKYLYWFSIAIFNHYQVVNNYFVRTVKYAVDLGHVKATLALACLYTQNTALSPISYYRTHRATGKKLFQKVVEMGHHKHAHFLAKLYEEEMNEKEAFKYYKIAADSGHVESIIKVSDYLENIDIVKSIEYLKKGVNKGEPNAQLKLAIQNLKGVGIPKNPQQAMYYAYLSARHGNEEAKFLFSLFFLTGYEVEQNFGFAKSILEKLDMLYAKLIVAKMYQYGLGSEVNIDKAKEIIYNLGDDQIASSLLEELEQDKYDPNYDIYYNNMGSYMIYLGRKERYERFLNNLKEEFLYIDSNEK